MESGDLQVGTRFGRYVIVERLAVGGMGVVYLARQDGIGGFSRAVVLKTLLADPTDLSALDRFLDEARVVASLAHENVVSVIEAGEQGGQPFLALEYVHGENAGVLLAHARRADVEVPLVVAARITSDAARGLAHAHRATDGNGKPLHIVHRDVTLQNIFVRLDGTSKIGDFGIARSAHRLSRTMTGGVPGTLPYMSPEQARGEDLSPRSDQFSLGIVLWELLTGVRLFRADSITATVTLILSSKISPPSALRPEASVLDAVVMRMLERDEKRRYPSLTDVAAALEACVPGTRLDVGERAVARFVDTLCGPQLRARRERIDSSASPETTTPLSSSPGRPRSDERRVSVGRQTEDRVFRVDRTQPDIASMETQLDLAPASNRRRTQRLAVRAAGVLIGLAIVCVGVWSWWERTGDTGELRTRAYLAVARTRNPLVHRDVFLAQVELAGGSTAHADAIVRPLMDLFDERLALHGRHWELTARERDERAVAVSEAERVLTDKARALLAPLGDPLAEEALALWAYGSAAPRQWIEPPSAAEIKASLQSDLLPSMDAGKALRENSVARMVRRLCANPEGVQRALRPLVAEREAVLARWAEAPLAELESLDDRSDHIKDDARRLLAPACGKDASEAIASIAFHKLVDPDDPEPLFPDTPPPLVR